MGCMHNRELVSEPLTATNQWPEHRCGDCGAVVITGQPMSATSRDLWTET